MADHILPAWPSSEAEVRTFEALRLTPGHWAALAPAPLFWRPESQRISSADFPLLHQLGSRWPTDPGLRSAAEDFWIALGRPELAHQVDTATGLLAWHLASNVTWEAREQFCDDLTRVAAGLAAIRSRFGSRLSDMSVWVGHGSRAPAFTEALEHLRQRIDDFLPCPAYTPHPNFPGPPPPEPAELVRFLPPDFWKQLLPAPLAGLLHDEQARDTTVQETAYRLSSVSLGNRSHPYPLAAHLRPVWYPLLEGLTRFPPVADRALTDDCTDLVVRGLAGLPFSQRSGILESLNQEANKILSYGRIDPNNPPAVVARKWLASLRRRIEEARFTARAANAATAPRPLPPPPIEAPPTALVGPVEPPPLPPLPHPPVPPPLPRSARSVPVVPPQRPTAETVRPFQTIPFDAALAHARSTTVADVRRWLENPTPLLFDDCREECRTVAIVRDREKVPPVLWLIGDIHADILALANLIAFAEARSAADGIDPAFVFLGDIVDRGQHDHESILFLFGLILKYPGRVCLIPGNHDVDPRFNKETQTFVSSLDPAEYATRLNHLVGSEVPEDREQVELAEEFFRFVRERPLSVFLPDGTLFAHAGFPHTDTHANLKAVDNLSHSWCVSDFLWARLSDSQRKRPNRGSRGHEFGVETFNDFCRLSDRIGVKVRRLVRGHDHYLSRYQYHEDYRQHPVLTLNAMGWRMEGELPTAEGRHPYPCIGRYAPEMGLPVVFRLPLDPDEVDRAFAPEPQVTEAPTKPPPPADAPPIVPAPEPPITESAASTEGGV